MAEATLASSDAAAMDRRILEKLMLLVVIQSLLRKEGDDDDAIDVGQEQELWVIVQRLLDAQLRLPDVGEKGRVEVLSSAYNHVTQLDLINNGLSGTLSESIGNLTYIEKLDLSDNDIKVICTIIHACLSSLAFISLHPTLTKQQCPS